MFIEILDKLIQLNLIRNLERSGEFSITVNYIDGQQDGVVFETEQKRNFAYNKLRKQLAPDNILVEAR